MEKDEKIRQVQSQRTRLIVMVLGLAAVVALVLGVWQNVPSGNDASRQVRRPKIPSDKMPHHHHPHAHEHMKFRKNTPRAAEQVSNMAEAVDKTTTGARQQQQRHDHAAVELDVKTDNTAADGESLAVLEKRVAEYDQHVREVKKKVELDQEHGFMETDPEGVAATKALQDATRQLITRRYGPRQPYRVKVDLEFQPSNPTYETDGPNDSFVMEMAPIALVPHAVYSFLEIARHWNDQKGAFHRRANHVLQAMTRGNAVRHLAFQEYSPNFPHQKGTVGYAGRPSGPGWYVSIQDNSRNHGPGSQQKRNPHEADACFGKIVEGFDRVVLGRITKMPGDGFLPPPAHVKITKMTILVPDETGAFVPWSEGAY